MDGDLKIACFGSEERGSGVESSELMERIAEARYADGEMRLRGVVTLAGSL